MGYGISLNLSCMKSDVKTAVVGCVALLVLYRLSKLVQSRENTLTADDGSILYN